MQFINRDEAPKIVMSQFSSLFFYFLNSIMKKITSWFVLFPMTNLAFPES